MGVSGPRVEAPFKARRCNSLDSPPSAETIEHGANPIEERIDRRDILGPDVAPRDSDPKGGADLGIGTGGRGEPRPPVAAGAPVALADVEGDGARRAPYLFAEVAIETPDRGDERRELLDGGDGEIEDEEGCALLMPPPRERI